MTNPDDARRTAVALHERTAQLFVDFYRKRDEAALSDFLYGRDCIAPHFDAIVSQLAPGAAVLDVGCGTGKQLQDLRERGLEAIGIEPAREMREAALERLPASAVRDGSALELPFDEESFDFVYSLEVFRYLTVADNLRGFREIARVLKPGGVFFGTFVNRYALDGFSLLVAGRRIADRLGKPISCHTELETPRRLRRHLIEAGFTHAVTHGAMYAPLRIVWKIFGNRITTQLARRLQPIDPLLCDGRITQAFAGHLIGIGRK